ncbi:MAG: hypothetical protein WA395_11775 [Nitrososphaeraceae archaeon]
MRVFRLANNTKIVVDIKKDVCLYNAPENPTNTGSTYVSGTDLYVHPTKNNDNQSYKYNWSKWQGSESTYELVRKEEAERFLESMTNDEAILFSFFGQKPTFERLRICTAGRNFCSSHLYTTIGNCYS